VVVYQVATGLGLKIPLISRFVRRQRDQLSYPTFLDRRRHHGRRPVSRTTFSGHLRSDLIRMMVLSNTVVGNIAGGAGKYQPAKDKAASVPPTRIKYRTVGNAYRSCR
jgi:hypothetical protein